MIAVHVSELTAVEGVFRLFHRGLLDDEVDGIVRLMIVDLVKWYLLLHFEGVAMIFSEWLLLNNDSVLVGVNKMFTVSSIAQMKLAAIIGCGMSGILVLIWGNFMTFYCREICMIMVGD